MVNIFLWRGGRRVGASVEGKALKTRIERIKKELVIALDRNRVDGRPLLTSPMLVPIGSERKTSALRNNRQRYISTNIVEFFIILKTKP